MLACNSFVMQSDLFSNYFSGYFLFYLSLRPTKRTIAIVSRFNVELSSKGTDKQDFLRFSKRYSEDVMTNDLNVTIDLFLASWTFLSNGISHRQHQFHTSRHNILLTYLVLDLLFQRLINDRNRFFSVKASDV